jgi:multidrug transporter EmrE-like cation transporter
MPDFLKAFFSINYFYWLLISMVFYAGGEFFSKKFALVPKVSFVIFLLLFYSLGALSWIVALHGKDELADVGVMWAVMSMLVTVSIGIFIFRERLNAAGIIGIILAAVAIVLLSRS